MSHMTDASGRDLPDWIDVLSHNNLLNWEHKQHNLGLLLTPILRSFGWHGDILTLTDALPASAKTISVNDLLAVMGMLGFVIEQERGSPHTVTAAQLPALYIPDHVDGWCKGILLREQHDYGLIWEDGRQVYRGNINGEMEDSRGILYRFRRETDRQAEEGQIADKPTEWLSGFCLRFKPLFLYALGLSLIIHLFSLIMPLFSMLVYDRVIGTRAIDSILPIVLGAVGAIGMEITIRWLRVRCAAWMGTRASLLIVASLFERLVYLPASMIEQASVSAQLARLRAFETVRDFLTGPVFLALLEVPFAIVLLGCIAALSGPVALVPLITLGCYGLLLFLLRGYWQRIGRESAHAAAQRQSVLMETLSNRKLVLAAGLERVMRLRFQRLSQRAAIKQHHLNMMTGLAQYAAVLLTVLGGIVMIDWSLVRIWGGLMTGGAMIASMILTWRLMSLLQTACAVLPQLEQIGAAARQVQQIMNLAPEVHGSQAVHTTWQLKGRITLQNISVRYNRQADPVFMGMTAEITPGQIVAIYGANSSGKSTVLRLLLGLVNPAFGQLRFDGIDYRQLDPRLLRRQIAYFPQSQEYLPGTIADNLRLIDPLAQDFKLRQALMWADAWDMVNALPDGMDTMLNDQRNPPSDGLIARLGLARMYLSDRPILICDELPSQLINNATGTRFRQFIEKCRGERTVIFVAQRDDWIGLADQVIWLKQDGRITTGKPAPALVKGTKGADDDN